MDNREGIYHTDGPIRIFDPVVFTEIKSPKDEQVGMDKEGYWYQYWRLHKGWIRLYDFSLSSIGITHGWFEEVDEGFGRYYFTFLSGFFWMTQNYNQAEWEGFRWQPNNYEDFRVMYRLLIGKPYSDTEITHPILEDY